MCLWRRYFPTLGLSCSSFGSIPGVTSIEATTLHGADYAQFPTLLNSTARRFQVKEVSADKAYLGLSNLEAAEAVGAFPSIPFKSNSTPRNKAGLWRKHYAFQ